jgi:hypothetical protein
LSVPICPCGCADTKPLAVLDWHSVAGFIRKNPDVMLGEFCRSFTLGGPYRVSELQISPACFLFRCPECGNIIHVEELVELQYHVMRETCVRDLPDGESGWQRVVVFGLHEANEALLQENSLTLKQFLQMHTYPVYNFCPQRTVLVAHHNGMNDSVAVYVRSNSMAEDSRTDAPADFSPFHYVAACCLSSTWPEIWDKQLLSVLKEHSSLIPAFFQTQCTDDEIPCFCDVAEDYMQETTSGVFFDALFQRVLRLENRQCREKLLGELRFAVEYVQDDVCREDYLRRINAE